MHVGRKQKLSLSIVKEVCFCATVQTRDFKLNNQAQHLLPRLLKSFNSALFSSFELSLFLNCRKNFYKVCQIHHSSGTLHDYFFHVFF